MRALAVALRLEQALERSQAIRLDPGRFLTDYFSSCACVQALLDGNASSLESCFPPAAPATAPMSCLESLAFGMKSEGLNCR